MRLDKNLYQDSLKMEGYVEHYMMPNPENRMGAQIMAAGVAPVALMAPICIPTGGLGALACVVLGSVLGMAAATAASAKFVFDQAFPEYDPSERAKKHYYNIMNAV